MAQTLKVVVTGPYGAGKSKFIGTISDIDVVSTERKLSVRGSAEKQQTTVAMDYGRVKIDGAIVHLNGTPGQARFDFMWEILTREMNAFVVMIDSCESKSFSDARDLIATFREAHDAPYLIAANKQDLYCAPSVVEIKRTLGLGADVLVMPCVATSKTSVRQVVKQTLNLIH